MDKEIDGGTQGQAVHNSDRKTNLLIDKGVSLLVNIHKVPQNVRKRKKIIVDSKTAKIKERISCI